MKKEIIHKKSIKNNYFCNPVPFPKENSMCKYWNLVTCKLCLKLLKAIKNRTDKRGS